MPTSAQHLAIEKQHTAERLVLRGRRHVLFHRQPREKRRDLRRAKLTGMSQTMKHDEPPDPVNVSVLGPPAVVPRADLRAHRLTASRAPAPFGLIMDCDGGRSLRLEFVTGVATAHGWGIAQDNQGTIYRFTF
jgi:hypothetical protein